MANLCLRMDCDIFSISETFKSLTKYGPSDPLFITEILFELIRKHGAISKNSMFVNMGICFFLKS